STICGSMEDSTMFLQWALSTLQHEHPPATPAPAYDDGGHTFPSSLPELLYSASLNSSMVPGEPPAREGHRATTSWSSGDSGGGGRSASTGKRSPSQNTVRYSTPPSSRTNHPVSWNFSSAAAAAQPSGDSAAASMATDDVVGGVPQMVQEPPLRRFTAKRSGSPSSSAPFHIIAERKRREKINQRFIELSTVIPGLKKMDKATILSDATRYVKELQEKLKAHEYGCSNVHRKVPGKKPCIAVRDDKDHSSPSRDVLPEIEARISEGNVMVRIHCEDVRGVLVRLLAEVEGLHLSIVHANAMPFSASTMIVNITAKASSLTLFTIENGKHIVLWSDKQIYQ
ncbi:hypothetical protein EJB05_05255, partial [Eragrostis curvula]